MTTIKKITWVFLAFLILYGCDDLFDKNKEIYERPEWLTGKVYSQLKNESDLSTFAKCLEIVGYDSIVNTSGVYTIFAPTNEAFSAYLASKGYSSVESIPLPILEELVKFHIVQNPWSKKQLRSLDVFGWIDTLDINNNKPKGFKRETLLREDNLKLGVKFDKNDTLVIVDESQSSWKRVIHTDARKQVPFFFQEYFSIYKLNYSDYQFYFNRSIDGPEDIYFAGSKVIGEEIIAENGFVYHIDKVVEPMRNGREILAEGDGKNSYSEYFALLNEFGNFTYNQTETFNQPGAKEGLQVDSLFNLTNPLLAFNIYNERTKAPRNITGLPSNVTIRYHHGLLAPTNEAFQSFVNDYIRGFGKWGSLSNAPGFVKRIIVNSYLCGDPIYPTDFSDGFYNGENDIVTLNQSDIVHKEFATNCTFIGLKKPIVPRAFESVTGPVYMQNEYSTVLQGIEITGLLSSLKKRGQSYMFFIEPDANLIADSSLVIVTTFGGRKQFGAFSQSESIPGQSKKITYFSTSDVRNLLMNHIGLDLPKGIARKEFIRNMAGNYLIVDNVTGIVRGTNPTFFGFQGSMVVNEAPTLINFNSDNGKTYRINNWFSFSNTSLYSQLSVSHTKFHNLLRDAGLVNLLEQTYRFVSANEIYTVFVPSDAAINNFVASNYTTEQLQAILKLHFVPGHLIFTDGNKPSGYYDTAMELKVPGSAASTYAKIFIGTAIDELSIQSKTGDKYVTIPESATTNLLTARSLSSSEEVIPTLMNNGVIHVIDKVLIPDELDTK